MRYCDNITLGAPGGGAPSVYLLRANSIYDPDAIAAGHQPLYHDQVSALYNHYVVVGSRLKATFYSEDAATTTGAVAGIYLSDDAAGPASIQAMQENLSQKGNHRWRFLRTAPGNSPGVTTVLGTYSAKKFHGIKNIADNKQDLGAAFGNNPSDEAYFILYVGQDGTNLPNIKCYIQIDYTVLVQEPKEVAQS